MNKNIKVIYDSEHYLDHWLYSNEKGYNISLIDLSSKNNSFADYYKDNSPWEVWSNTPGLMSCEERYSTKEEAIKRIQELLNG